MKGVRQSQDTDQTKSFGSIRPRRDYINSGFFNAVSGCSNRTPESLSCLSGWPDVKNSGLQRTPLRCGRVEREKAMETDTPTSQNVSNNTYAALED